MKNYDIFLVGLGGQGVLTIGELISEAASRKGIPVNYYPSKGMAQRGGFVKAQIRLGRETVGPNIPQKGADLVIAMELSEALRAVKYLKPGHKFVLFDHVWAPAAVMLGKASYPTLEQVREQVQKDGGEIVYLDSTRLPQHNGEPVPANIFALGTAVGHAGLGDVMSASDIEQVMQDTWKRGAEQNLSAFRAGLEFKPQ